MPFVDQLINAKVVSRVGNHFELTKEYVNKFGWKFKKLTGTKLAAALGCAKFETPFQLWCSMVGIFKPEMDPTLSLIGQYAEPKIRDYAQKQLGYEFIVYDPKEINFDAFKNIDPVFAGIPDGEPKGPGNIPDYSNGKRMIEVKSSSIDKLLYKPVKGELRMQKDEQGVPIVKLKGAKKLEWFDDNGQMVPSKEYQCQLGLYLFLRKQTKGIFAVGFLTPEEYVHPEKFVASSDNVYLIDFEITNRDNFAKLVEQAREWYKRHIKTGISPEITPKDEKWLEETELKLN